MYNVVCVCVLCDKVLVLYGSVSEVDIEAVVRFVKGLQRPDGSFTGDKWGGCTHKHLSVCVCIVHTLLQVKWTRVFRFALWPALLCW